MKTQFGEFLLDTDVRMLRRSGRSIVLEPRSYDVLVYLIENRDRAVGKDELQDRVWKTVVSDSAITRSVMKLRKALDDHDGRLIVTVPRFGYRFDAGAVDVATDGVIESAIDGAIVDTAGGMSADRTDDAVRAARPVRFGPKGLAVLILGVVAVTVAIAAMRAAWYRDVPAVADKSVAVLPFDDLSAGQDQQWFADGLAAEVMNALARAPDLNVASRSTSFFVRDAAGDAVATAAGVGISHVLEGSVRRDADRLRVTARLTRTSDGLQVWSENYDSTGDEVIDVQERIAASIANALETTMDEQSLARMVSAGTSSVPAFQSYLEGLAGHARMVETGDNSSYLASIDAFEKAVGHDPRFDLAHYEIASYWLSQMSPTSIAAGRPDVAADEMDARFVSAVTAAIRETDDPVRELRYRTLMAIYEAKYRRVLQMSTRLLDILPNDRAAQNWRLNALARLNRFGDVAQFALVLQDRFGFDPVTTPRSLMMAQYSNDSDAIRSLLGGIPPLADRHAISMYQRHRALLWIGEHEAAAQLLAEIESSDLAAANRQLAQLRQACAERRLADAEELYARLSAALDGRRGTLWLAAKTFGDEDLAGRIAGAMDANDRPREFSGLLLYGMFDPQPYTNLMRHLRVHGDEAGDVIEVPYRCRQPDAGISG